MPMPETAMDEDDRLATRKNQVWTTRQSSGTSREPESCTMETSTNEAFGLRARTSHRLHHLAPSLGAKRVGHYRTSVLTCQRAERGASPRGRASIVGARGYRRPERTPARAFTLSAAHAESDERIWFVSGLPCGQPALAVGTTAGGAPHHWQTSPRIWLRMSAAAPETAPRISSSWLSVGLRTASMRSATGVPMR